MRRTHIQIAIAVLGLAAVVALIATGVLGDSSPPNAGPVGSGVATALDTPTDPADRPAARSVITLGALHAPPTTGSIGAPFDPCTVIDWTDLPAPVRPATATRPVAQKPASGEDFVLGCRWDNSGPALTDDHSAPSGGDSAVFTVTLTWGPTAPGPLTASRQPGATAALFGGRAGVRRAGTDAHGHPMCTGLMPVTTGAAGAIVTNARFASTDPCAVVTAALDAVATTVP